MARMMPFTVFLPVYNEEEILVPNMEKLLRYLDSLQTPYEVLIGSNGSDDATLHLGEALEKQYPHLRFFHIPEKGPGTALRKAIGMMSHDGLITLDMDLPVPLDFIPKAVELLDDHDIVVGSKKLGGRTSQPLPAVGEWSIYILLKMLLGLPFEDYSLGAKAYRKTVLKRYEASIDRWTLLYGTHHLFRLPRWAPGYSNSSRMPGRAQKAGSICSMKLFFTDSAAYFGFGFWMAGRKSGE